MLLFADMELGLAGKAGLMRGLLSEIPPDGWFFLLPVGLAGAEELLGLSLVL